MDGVLIAPGAEPSFNQMLGTIDETNEFTQRYAMIGGRAQLGWAMGCARSRRQCFARPSRLGCQCTLHSWSHDHGSQADHLDGHLRWLACNGP